MKKRMARHCQEEGKGGSALGVFLLFVLFAVVVDRSPCGEDDEMADGMDGSIERRRGKG
jgi:hypothetical protein